MGDRMHTVQRIAKNGGVLSFALVFAGMFGVFADLGLWQLTVRVPEGRGEGHCRFFQ
ncbi:MAG: hypothetical protein IMF18_11905 [Proteobacteria bacterium]|nr:hypothetical protein [Pseudomonadota bacterium]